jgi:hypothetical protein
MVKINIYNHMEGHLITLLPLTNIHILLFPLIRWGTPTSTPDAFGLSIKYRSTPNPTYDPNSGGSTSTYYTPYGSFPQNNPYFPFLGPPQPVVPPPKQPHVGSNFVHPSPIQQVHDFEQLNMETLAHQLNNSKNKGKKMKQ